MNNKINPVEGKLTIIDAEGNERLCVVLFTCKSEEFGKNYVVFSPIEQDEDDDKQEVFAASYTEGEEGNGELQQIESDEEWAFIEEIFEDFEEQFLNSQEGCGCGCGHHCEDGECDGECDDEEEHHCGCGCCHHEE